MSFYQEPKPRGKHLSLCFQVKQTLKGFASLGTAVADGTLLCSVLHVPRSTRQGDALLMKAGEPTSPLQPSQLKTPPGSGLCTLPFYYSEQNLIRSVSSWFNAVDICILKLQSWPKNYMNFHCFSYFNVY